ALLEELDVGHLQARIDEGRVDLRELDDLGVDVDVARLRKMREAVRRLERADLAHALAAGDVVDVSAQKIVGEGKDLFELAARERLLDDGVEAFGIALPRIGLDPAHVRLRVTP